MQSLQPNNYILSIDIGIKNMCFVILNNKLPLQQKQQINGKYIVNPNAITVSKILVRDLSDQNQITIINKLKHMLDDICEGFDINFVIIEKQIGKFAFKQLEFAIFMYIQLKMPSIRVFSIHPSHKLKIAFQQEQPNVQRIKSKYSQNKKDAITQLDTYQLLTQNQDVIDQIEINKKNKPDIADALLQAFYVFNCLIES